MSIYDVFSGGNRPFDKEEWAAAKQAQRKEAYELIDNTCSEMVASGDSFRQYLDVQGRFDRYSVANAILVSAQMPEATQLKEYSKAERKTALSNWRKSKRFPRYIGKRMRTMLISLKTPIFLPICTGCNRSEECKISILRIARNK